MSFKKFKQRLRRLELNETVEETVEDTVAEKSIEDMNKLELDEYALNYGIELDRRKTKPNMIKSFLAKLKGEK